MVQDLHNAELSYGRLKRSEVNDSVVEQINRLLPQLSESAPPLTMKHLRKVLSSGTKLFVARDGDKIVGTVLLCRKVGLVGKTGLIEDVVTDEAYRKRGIADTLMRLTMAFSKKRGDRRVDLTSRFSRVDAGNLYERLGFVLHNTRYYKFVHPQD